MGRVGSTTALIIGVVVAGCGETDPAAPAVTPDPTDPPDSVATAAPDLSCYQTVEQIEASIAAIAAAHPAIVELQPAIGASWERTIVPEQGHDILALRISNPFSPHPKAPVLIVGGLHARELAAPDFLLRFSKHLAEQYAVDPDITWLLDHTDIRVVPLANPDGRARVPSAGFPASSPDWRKNADWLNGPCAAPPADGRGIGVDLNRNFGIDWLVGSDPCLPDFPGPSPGSEPETQAIVRYAESLFGGRDPAQGFYVDVHTPGPFPLEATANAVLWPWGARESTDDLELVYLGRHVARRASTRGWQALDYQRDVRTEQVGGPITAEDYERARARGTSMDFMYETHARLPSLSFEMGTRSTEDCGYFERTIVPRYTSALLYVLKAARDAYRLAPGPTVRLLNAAPIGTVGNLATLYAQAGAAHFPGDSDNVVRVAYSLSDLPPSRGALTLPDMIALDGSIDGVQEEMQAIVDISDSPAGRHLVFVHGRDDEGDWGLVSATWLQTPGFNIDGRAFEFTGTVTSVEVPDGFPIDEVLPGYSFSPGDTFRGYFAFKPDARDWDSSNPALSRHLEAITSASVTFDAGWAGTGARIGSSPQLERIEVVNMTPGEPGPALDRYWVHATMVDGPNLLRIDPRIPPDFRRVDPAGRPFAMGLSLTDTRGLALSSDALPQSPPNLSAFETRSFYLGFGPDGGSDEVFWVLGKIETLTLADFSQSSADGAPGR